MIIDKRGDILTSAAAYIVIPVNTVGVMGKGLALQAAKRWPDVDAAYRRWCAKQRPKGGDYVMLGSDGPCIICLATKEHWRNPSRLEWIEHGLGYLQVLAQFDQPIALPMIGCGLGGLPEETVEPLIRRYLGDEPAEVELWKA